MLLVHRRDVIEPVEIGQRLQIGLVLDQLLGPAGQQADVGIDALYDLAVELEHEAQYAVGGGMLRPEIDGEITKRRLVHPGSFTPVGPAVAVLRQVRQNRQVRRRVSSAQVWLIGYALRHRAPLDFPSRRRGFSPHSATSRRRAPRSGARARARRRTP